jgi:hypothetical protein
MHDSAARKATPIFSGVMRYFPDALAAVARLSKKGNDKHNPGEPLHWSREKSTDHGDCIARHQITFDQIDPESGEYHAAGVAWRALAQLQLLEEAKRLGDLAGPMGKVEPRVPEPGEEWENGIGKRPAWAADGVLVECRGGPFDPKASVLPAHVLSYLSCCQYRKHRA